MEEKGLTSKEVERMVEKGKTNYIENKASKSSKEIVFSNIFTYFNLIFAIITVLLVTTGAFRNLTFLPVIDSILSTTSFLLLTRLSIMITS